MAAPPIVCTLTEPELRERRDGLLRRVRERVVEARRLPVPDSVELAVGFELRFAGDEATVADVLELVRLESRCCAFLRFRVTLEPGAGPVVVEVSGPPGSAELLATELVPSMARGAGPLTKEQEVWVFRSDQPLPASATEEMVQQVREDRDRANLGKGE